MKIDNQIHYQQLSVHTMVAVLSAGVVSTMTRGAILSCPSPTRHISLHPGVRRQSASRYGQKHRAVALEDAIYTYIAAAGDVEAPNGALIAAAIGISALVLLIPFALRPGIDAAEKMQERVRCVSCVL